MKIEQNTELKKMAYKYQQLTDKLKKACGLHTLEVDIDTEGVKRALLEIENAIPGDICAVIQLERGIK